MYLFCWLGHVFSSLWSNLSKVTSVCLFLNQEWHSEWQSHMLSCPGQLKRCFFYQKWRMVMIECHNYNYNGIQYKGTVTIIIILPWDPFINSKMWPRIIPPSLKKENKKGKLFHNCCQSVRSWSLFTKDNTFRSRSKADWKRPNALWHGARFKFKENRTLPAATAHPI